jgi:hypothetical protein
LQVNIPPDDLAKPPPPKSEPSFELEPLPNDLKYDFLDDTKVYILLLLSLNFLLEKKDYYVL